MVQTSKGLIDSTLLRVEDHVSWTENARVVKTCWYLGDEEVRSDIHVEVLQGLGTTVIKGDPDG